ncbi:cytochrome P450 [Dendryphion nanum]|uniref:Cytochrome P450 n=1 Tax=Dendryphion nanum TaxID=256645 RepID=A0A9P9IMD1_9PLEO|nr:cytochrome P450 [Dendryphion nanum]
MGATGWPVNRLYLLFAFFPVLAAFHIVFRIRENTIRLNAFRQFALSNNCEEPPAISGSFIAGIKHKWKRLYQRGDIFNDYMGSVFRKHGPTHAIVDQYSGETKTLYTIEPENVKTILYSKFTDYYRPNTMPNALNPVMGEGLITANGAAWAHSRSLVRAQVSTSRVRNVAQLDKHLQNIFEALGGTMHDGWTEEQEILLIFNRFTLDSATEFLFGTSARSHEAAMEEKNLFATNQYRIGSWGRYKRILTDFGTAFDTTLDYVALRLKLGRFWFLADGLAFRLACFKVRNFADNYIRDAIRHAESAKASVGESGDTLDDRKFGLLSELSESYPDKVELRNQVMQLLVAGRDTTAATLTWALIVLDTNPLVFDRLRSAVIRHFGTESKPTAPVTFENLRSCTYLQWFISEVLRLWPTAPLNARKASKDTVLPVGGGADGRSPIAVKAHTTVAYNVYLMHRSETLWGDDGWDFKPERWEGKKAGWEYVPFHGGPQTCLGQLHAITEIAYVITRMLQRYSHISSSTRSTNLENGIRTILAPKHTVLFRFQLCED